MKLFLASGTLQKAIAKDCGVPLGETPLRPAVKMSLCNSFGHHEVSSHDNVMTCVNSFAELEQSEGRRARVVSQLTAPLKPKALFRVKTLPLRGSTEQLQPPRNLRTPIV